MPDYFSKTSEALLEAVANAAVELLRLHDIERSLPKILEMLGTATDADRMQLMRIERDGAGKTQIVSHHEWCAPGIPPAAGLQSIEGRIMEEDGFGEWAAKFSRGEVIFGTVGDFEEPIRDRLVSDGICSLAVVPVFVDGRWWGQIGFDDCRAVRTWVPGEIDALRTLAELIGTAVLRARDIERLADARRIVENSPTLLFRLGSRPPFPLRYVSPNIARYGYTAADLLSHPDRWLELIDSADRPELMNAIETMIGAGECETNTEFRLVRPDGGRVWFEGHSTAYRDKASNVIAIEGIITDITDRKQAARDIERLARTDTLTGLANRGVFLDRLARACRRAKKHGEQFAVHFIDLDLFKPVNDTLGHPAGDELLKAVARRLCLSVRKDDVVARFGGDEFAVLQYGIASPEGAGHMAAKICKAVSEPYTIAGHGIEISASVGVVCQQPARVTPEDVMACADLALYRAKSDGRNRVCVYDVMLDCEGRSAPGRAVRSAPAA